MALHSGAVLSENGEDALKESMDRKNETMLKIAYEVMCLAIRALAVLSYTHAIHIQVNELLQNPEGSPLESSPSQD